MDDKVMHSTPFHKMIDEEVDVCETSLKKYANDDSQSSASSSDSDEQYDVITGSFPITPFNMKEELKEGYFDSDGNYFFKNKQSDSDKWLESINWNSKLESNLNRSNSLLVDSSDSDTEENVIEIYSKIISYLKPNETISNALHRLGKNTVSTSERWKLKKCGKDVNSNHENLKKVTDLTELANYILNKFGNIDVYQETYEKLLEKVSQRSKLNEKINEHQLSLKRKLPELDMYCDDFEEKERALLKVKKP